MRIIVVERQKRNGRMFIMENKKTGVSEKSLSNLKRFDEMDPETRRAMASKGGYKSAEVQRKKKKLKEELKLILEIGDNQKRMSTALFNRSLNDDNIGNKAFEIIRDTIGEKPTDKVENTNFNKTIDEYVKKVEDKDEY